tara:strand:+ start:792 stop:1040 length:249 start_codon:yes stop_codon:yes gene_type:complete
MKIKLLSRADREEMVKKLATLDESSDEAKDLRQKVERNICLPPKAAAAPAVEEKPAPKPAPKPAAKSWSKPAAKKAPAKKKE